jgi:ABC-type dipeptide/oligopeptide/nickel transport system permease component
MLVTAPIDRISDGDYTLGQMINAFPAKSNWWSYIGKKLVWLPVIFLILSAVIFFSVNSGDGPPMSFTPGFTKEDVMVRMNYLGLDLPVVNRYFIWLGGVLKNDLGDSWQTEIKP